jgi:uncharacterized protein YbjT (DUF2867 family)
MTRRILILGATGILGQSVTHSLVKTGNQVRVLVRNHEKAHEMFGNEVEIFRGNVLDKENIQSAMSGCQAVHLSLPQESELIAMEYVTELGKANGLERISYISATTAFEANRWYKLIDVKLRTEKVLRSSGIPNTIFCPTWAMETLLNFIRGNRAVVIISKNPPPLHFLAAADLGRMVATSYEDNRALGERLFVHGPESMTMPEAFKHYVKICHPGQKITEMKLWQAQLVAKLTRKRELAGASSLIAYFDKVREMGDPTEANALLGSPSTTFDEWVRIQKLRSNDAAEHGV